MFSDGYENYCSELVDYATGHETPAHEKSCECEEFQNTSNTPIPFQNRII